MCEKSNSEIVHSFLTKIPNLQDIVKKHENHYKAHFSGATEVTENTNHINFITEILYKLTNAADGIKS